VFISLLAFLVRFGVFWRAVGHLEIIGFVLGQGLLPDHVLLGQRVVLLLDARIVEVIARVRPIISTWVLVVYKFFGI
jgi:hypothetical protein